MFRCYSHQGLFKGKSFLKDTAPATARIIFVLFILYSLFADVSPGDLETWIVGVAVTSTTQAHSVNES